MPNINNKNSWTLYSSNEEAWASILEDCSKAQTSIDLEQFIFATDDFGQKLIDVCAERARNGVQVRFLWDAAGSFTFWGSNIAEDLRSKSIELLFWRTLIPEYFQVPDFRSWYLRNHRRTLVIDNEIGYTGSICVDDRLKNWRDTNVRLEGPVANKMQKAFNNMWLRAKENKVRFPKHKPIPKTNGFSYITNFPFPRRRLLYKTIVDAIRNSSRYIYITTPYFVPTHRLFKAIKNAAERGVQVIILLPEKTDHYSVDLGARSFFSALMESGVKIFLYTGNIIHSKSIVIDGKWSTVGSLNLDSASLLYNFEANIVSTDPEFAKELESHFITDIQNSIEVSITEWKSRFFLEKIPEILIKLVKKFL
jgi:cardiolipin synthase